MNTVSTSIHGEFYFCVDQLSIGSLTFYILYTIFLCSVSSILTFVLHKGEKNPTNDMNAKVVFRRLQINPQHGKATWDTCYGVH